MSASTELLAEEELDDMEMSRESVDLAHDLLDQVMSSARGMPGGKVKHAIDVPLHMLEHVIMTAPNDRAKAAVMLYVIKTLGECSGVQVMEGVDPSMMN